MKGSGWDLETIERAGLRAGAARLHAAAGDADRAVRPADGERARHAHRCARARRRLRWRRCCTPCCRTSTSTTRTPTRCCRSPTRPTATSASATSTATASSVIPYVMAGLRPRRVLRARVPEAGDQEHHRHGAALARRVLVRRRRARVLRAHDRAGVDGRATTWRRRRPGASACRAARAAGVQARGSGEAAPRGIASRGLSAAAAGATTRRASSASRSIRTWRSISQGGPATPDHVHPHQAGADARDGTWTRLPLRYREYFEKNAKSAKEPKTMLDPAPRMALDPELGFAAFGRTRERRAHRRRPLRAHHRRHPARRGARRLAGARRQAHSSTSSTGTSSRPSCAKAGAPPVFAGEVALVTGAASGIGKACAEAFLKRGAAVVGLDRESRDRRQCASGRISSV